MPKKGENIYKRKDGRWEGRYIRTRTADGKAVYGSVYASTYREAKTKLISAVAATVPSKRNLPTVVKRIIQTSSDVWQRSGWKISDHR